MSECRFPSPRTSRPRTPIPSSTSPSRSIPSIGTTCRCCARAASCWTRKPYSGWPGLACHSGQPRAAAELLFPFLAALRLLIGGDHRLRRVSGHLFVVREPHRVLAPSLGDPAEIDGEPVHRRVGH